MRPDNRTCPLFSHMIDSTAWTEDNILFGQTDFSFVRRSDEIFLLRIVICNWGLVGIKIETIDGIHLGDKTPIFFALNCSTSVKCLHFIEGILEIFSINLRTRSQKRSVVCTVSKNRCVFCIVVCSASLNNNNNVKVAGHQRWRYCKMLSIILTIVHQRPLCFCKETNIFESLLCPYQFNLAGFPNSLQISDNIQSNVDGIQTC